MTTKTKNILLISASAIAVLSLALYLTGKKKYEALEKTYTTNLEGMTIENTDKE